MQNSTLSGTKYTHEKRLFVWFRKETRIQKWSPFMHEYERWYGIRVGHIKLGVSFTNKHFLDGKDPKVVRGEY
jgi:hypothetical protein